MKSKVKEIDLKKGGKIMSDDIFGIMSRDLVGQAVKSLANDLLGQVLNTGDRYSGSDTIRETMEKLLKKEVEHLFNTDPRIKKLFADSFISQLERTLLGNAADIDKNAAFEAVKALGIINHTNEINGEYLVNQDITNIVEAVLSSAILFDAHNLNE